MGEFLKVKFPLLKTIRTRIWCMLLPKDDKFLFIGDAKKSLIQLSTSTFTPVKIYQGFPEDIYSFACTSDSTKLFAGHYKGYLSEICVESQEVSKSYGKIHFDSVVSMEIDPKDKMLYTSGYDHYMKQIIIPEQKVFKCHGQIQANDVEALCKFFCCKNLVGFVPSGLDSFLLTTDACGYHQMFKIDRQTGLLIDTHTTTENEYGEVHIHDPVIEQLTDEGIKCIRF
jgi:hypothetical protein